MSQSLVPSTALLRAVLRPSKGQCPAQQARNVTNWVPRHKYAKVNRLDKLHRAQKAELRQRIENNKVKAVKLENQLKSSVTSMLEEPIAYHMARTSTHNLPIYEHRKGGGTKFITQIQKLSGNLAAMQEELRTVLGLQQKYTDAKGRKKEPVKINELTKHIIIDGWRGEEVKKWAQLRGF